jgi:hypothetical protein
LIVERATVANRERLADAAGNEADIATTVGRD